LPPPVARRPPILQSSLCSPSSLFRQCRRSPPSFTLFSSFLLALQHQFRLLNR
jgi:hypothetical protein